MNKTNLEMALKKLILDPSKRNKNIPYIDSSELLMRMRYGE